MKEIQEVEKSQQVFVLGLLLKNVCIKKTTKKNMQQDGESQNANSRLQKSVHKPMVDDTAATSIIFYSLT